MTGRAYKVGGNYVNYRRITVTSNREVALFRCLGFGYN